MPTCKDEQGYTKSYRLTFWLITVIGMYAVGFSLGRVNVGYPTGSMKLCIWIAKHGYGLGMQVNLGRSVHFSRSGKS